MVRAAPAFLLLATLAGCSSLGGSAGDRDIAPPPPPVARQAGATDGLAVYLQTLRSLIEGDPVVQADVFRDVTAAADVAPTTTNRLMLALALATPTHPASNDAEAAARLNDLLATGDCCPRSTFSL
jgi:hypothetical protein